MAQRTPRTSLRGFPERPHAASPYPTTTATRRSHAFMPDGGSVVISGEPSLAKLLLVDDALVSRSSAPEQPLPPFVLCGSYAAKRNWLIKCGLLLGR